MERPIATHRGRYVTLGWGSRVTGKALDATRPLRCIHGFARMQHRFA